MISLNDIPSKTLKGIDFINHASFAEKKRIGLKLRHVLILIDGKKTVSEIIASNVYGIQMDGIETLLREDFITFDKITDLQHAPNQHVGFNPLAITPESTKSFSKIRFEILNILLDLSMQDFSIRPWIDKFENTTNLEELGQVIKAFSETSYAIRFGLEVQKIKSLL